jgi:hypothetical protein
MTETSIQPNPIIPGTNSVARYRRRNGAIENIPLDSGSIQVFRTATSVTISAHEQPGSHPVTVLRLTPEAAEALAAALNDPDCGRIKL